MFAVMVQLMTTIATGLYLMSRDRQAGCYRELLMYTVFHKKGSLFLFFIIYSNDDQFT